MDENYNAVEMDKKYNIKPGTVARIVVLLVLLTNQALVVAGLNPVPISEEELYQNITAVLTTAWALWAAWKNNSLTLAARVADEYMEQLKSGC